jgi:hypothetical protein
VGNHRPHTEEEEEEEEEEEGSYLTATLPKCPSIPYWSLQRILIATFTYTNFLLWFQWHG